MRLGRVVGCLRYGAWTFQLDCAKRDQNPSESTTSPTWKTQQFRLTDHARRSAQTTDNAAKLQTTRQSRSHRRSRLIVSYATVVVVTQTVPAVTPARTSDIQ